MLSLPAIAIIVLIIALAVVVHLLLGERMLRKQRGFLKEWPIKRVLPEVFHPIFKTGPHGPTTETEIRTVGAYRVYGGISDFETWIICNLARKAEQIFEFGTATGKTTYLLAANAPQAQVTPLTLSPDDLDTYQESAGDTQTDRIAAKDVSRFDSFYYQGTTEENRIVQIFIVQIFGDNKEFDHASHKGTMDLIFIDGSHAKSYVESDTQKALEMIKPGGVILWHDYRGPKRAKDVFSVLNNLSKRLDLVWIANTSFVAYRHS